MAALGQAGLRAGGRNGRVGHKVVAQRVDRLGRAAQLGMADGAVDDLVIAACLRAGRRDLVLANRRCLGVTRGRNDLLRDLIVAARAMAALGQAGLRAGGRNGRIGDQIVPERFADGNRQRIADRAANVTLDIAGRRLCAGRLACHDVGGRSREAVRAEGLPRQSRGKAAAAGVLLEGLAQLGRHIRRGERLGVDRRAAVGKAVADALQAVDLKIIAVGKGRSAARRDK